MASHPLVVDSLPSLRRYLTRRALDWWQLAAAFPRSIREASRYAGQFEGVHAFCLFLGAGRSGHTLIGSLLNAHPDAVIGNELDVLRYLLSRISRNQLYALILYQDQKFQEGQQQWETYDYAVPGQWQGKLRRLRVIGDKKSGMTSLRLAKEPELLDRVREKVGVPLRFINQIRNPYDNITTMAEKSHGTLERSFEQYFLRIDAAQMIIDRLDPSEFLNSRLEDFIASPREHLAELIRFLGLEEDDGYLDACVEHVFASARRTRDRLEWSEEMIDRVAEKISRYPFLQGYRFDA